MEILTPDRPLRRMAERGLAWQLALIVSGSWAIALSAGINVPMIPVPMSMQSFAIILIAALAGRTLATQIILAYLIQGAVGMPVFAGGGGLAYMAGPSGGYLAGFLPAAMLVGHLADQGWNRRPGLLMLAAMAAHGVILLLGLAWLQSLMGSVTAALQAGVLPFIPGMLLKSALVVLLVLIVTANRRPERQS
ncbi:biotin transporter BioY [Granulosicoccaceae sp. 1_MG-2023]|nr:biotin transporter BioY [Granulosicoccaceae sp. 1_MG-2023]